MTTDELRRVLQEWWCLSNAGRRRHWNEVKLAWLREFGYIFDTGRKLSGAIYRWNLGEPEPAGISGTLSSEQARRFRFSGSRRVAPSSASTATTAFPRSGATVDGSNVLAYFGSRGEQEVIVDPTTLYHVEVVGRPRLRGRRGSPIT